MAIDITNQEVIRKLTREDLVNDAIERGDLTAWEWLNVEFFKEVPCKDKEGKPTGDMKPNPLISIRADYLRKFLGYTPNSNKPNNEAQKMKLKAEREAALHKMMDEARAKLLEKAMGDAKNG